ncbi:non-specific lipid-transfer protein P5-like [Typha latifolia]|uniref:non-specific lipid-transfer protein P5-like n=1 Tax=Typha latifolia TaxID=4733 RepID=UPI003C2BA477
MARSNSRALALGFVLVVALVAAPHAARAAMMCSQVYTDLLPCLAYMQNGGSAVPAECCGGIKQLLASAASKADRRSICGCIKNAAAGVSGGSIGRAAALPKKCGVSIPYKISPNTDCTKIN